MNESSLKKSDSHQYGLCPTTVMIFLDIQYDATYTLKFGFNKNKTISNMDQVRIRVNSTSNISAFYVINYIHIYFKTNFSPPIRIDP